MVKPMDPSKMSDAEWKAQMDANTLGQAEMIKMDGKRMKAAQDMAKMMAEEAMMRANAMGKIAGMKKENGNTKMKSDKPKGKMKK